MLLSLLRVVSIVMCFSFCLVTMSVVRYRRIFLLFFFCAGLLDRAWEIVKQSVFLTLLH